MDRTLREAYGSTNVDTRKRLRSLLSWLESNGHEDAAGRLREGMEETLTILKLDLPLTLRRSLATTNAIEENVLRNKTDRTDTGGMLEAYRNQEIRTVPVKTVPQQILGTLHRLRSGWLAERTARINALRGLLRELGFVIPVGAKHVLPRGLGDPRRRGVWSARRPASRPGRGLSGNP